MVNKQSLILIVWIEAVPICPVELSDRHFWSSEGGQLCLNSLLLIQNFYERAVIYVSYGKWKQPQMAVSGYGFLRSISSWCST